MTGAAAFVSPKASLRFEVGPQERRVSVHWPGFHAGRGIRAEIVLACPPEHESMNVVIPIGGRRFYDKPGKIFPLLYKVLLGQERGPRLGAFIKLVTPARILVILQAALS